MNKYNLIIHDSAFEDLELIFYYCKTNYGILHSSKVVIKILEAIYSLRIFPNANPIFSINNNTIIRKRIVNKRYVIIFKVLNNSIYIYNILDGRKNINSNNLFN